MANSSSPLNETSVSCAQGVFGDDSFACESKAVSHRVSSDLCALQEQTTIDRALRRTTKSGNNTWILDSNGTTLGAYPECGSHCAPTGSDRYFDLELRFDSEKDMPCRHGILRNHCATQTILSFLSSSSRTKPFTVYRTGIQIYLTPFPNLFCQKPLDIPDWLLCCASLVQHVHPFYHMPTIARCVETLGRFRSHPRSTRHSRTPPLGLGWASPRHMGLSPPTERSG